MYFLEGGPFLCVPPPTGQHDLIKQVWAQNRLRQVDLKNKKERDEVWDPWRLQEIIKINK